MCLMKYIYIYTQTYKYIDVYTIPAKHMRESFCSFRSLFGLRGVSVRKQCAGSLSASAVRPCALILCSGAG